MKGIAFALMLACASFAFAETAAAQSALPTTPVQRERICILEARRQHLTGQAFNTFMDRCAHVARPSGPAIPPAQPPTAAPPAQPKPAGPPPSPRAVSCGKMVAELGLTGAAAKAYYDRCVAR